MTLLRALCLGICAGSAALLLQCSSSSGPPPVTTTGGSEVVGIFITDKGDAAANAVVKLDTAKDTSAYVPDSLLVRASTTTDANGSFSFYLKNTGGAYTISASYKNGQLVAFIPPFKNNRPANYNDTFYIPLGTTRMVPPGWIFGAVEIDKADMAGVTCYINNPSLIAITDSLGKFTINGVPPGTYKVTFFYPQYIPVRDTPVTVMSSVGTSVGTVILFFDPTQQQPAPRNVTLSYDVVHGTVVVRWSAVHISDLTGYYIYRQMPGENSPRLIDSVSKNDNMYRDLVFPNFQDFTEKDISYSIQASDSGNNTGLKSNPVVIHAVPPIVARTVFLFSAPGTVNDTAEVDDTVKIAVSFANRTHATKRLTWYVSSTDSVVRATDFDSLAGSDTLPYVWKTTGTKTVICAALDDSGNTWLDTTYIVIVNKPPQITSISPAQVVEFGGSVECRCVVSHRYGRFFVEMGPSVFGVTQWVVVSHKDSVADTAFAMGNASSLDKIAVRVTDNYGNAAEASVKVDIRPRAVDVVSIVPADTTVTVYWNRSLDSDFLSYRLYMKRAAPAADTILASVAGKSDTMREVPMRTNGSFEYYVVVLDTEELASSAGKSMAAAIMNTAPKFTNDTTAISKKAAVGGEYRVVLLASDKNGDACVFEKISDLPGLTLSGNVLLWTPTIQDTGIKAFSVRVGDGHGGFDTLAWNVTVAPSGIWSVYPYGLKKARFFLSASMVGGTVYAVGGAWNVYSAGKTQLVPLNTVESCDIGGSGAWTLAAPLPTTRYAMALASLNSRLFAFGGTKDGINYISSIDSFSAAGNQWDTAGQLLYPIAGAAVCTVGSKIYLIGGQALKGGLETVSKQIYEYDITTGDFTSKTTYMSTERAYHQAVSLNGKIYIFGGLGGSADIYSCEVLRSMEIYDPQTNRIISDTIDSMTMPRHYFGAAEVGGRIYAIGGRSTQEPLDTSLATVEQYDPAQNKWVPAGNMPEGRHGFATATWQGRIYVIGGIVNNKATNSVLVYYP
jgi:hypothetical protein